MRGADASAGTIKSGGATRRAAKMVVLDVDHPDIEEFIETKVSEEERSASCAMRASTWTSGARTSRVSSTRTPTTACGSPTSSCVRWRAVTSSACGRGPTARSSRRLDAKQLFRKMSEAAWACATRHPVRRHHQRLAHQPRDRCITASNPVLGVHVAWTTPRATCLAEPAEVPADDGSFAAEKFSKAVQLIITAMDISICFADFPTEAIGGHHP